MASLMSPFRRVGHLVTGHVQRLHTALERLTTEVRAAIARAIGQATGDAVREALDVILGGPPGRLTTDDLPEDRERFWGQPPRPSWPSQAYDPYAHDRYQRDPDEEFERRHEQDYGRHDDELTESEPVTQPQTSVWSRAVATGCQAASWWLRRHQGRFSPVVAVGLGIASGVATLVGGRFVAAWSAVTASALGVLALADAARSAAGLASAVMK